MIYEVAPVNLRATAGAVSNMGTFTGYLYLMILGFWTPETPDE